MKLAFYKAIEQESQLEEFKLLFDEHNIKYEVSSPDMIIDSTIVGSKLISNYTLKFCLMILERPIN